MMEEIIKMFDVPVVFIIFNRIETTKRVFEQIKTIRPERLYIVSDGPRDGVKGENELVDNVRSYVEDNIDWECDVRKDYAQNNVGCGKRIATGLDWVFEQEEMAIILEDDCMPDLSFFEYAKELLEYYKDDKRIMLISGNNPMASFVNSKESYIFSKIPFIWGWATWKRAWKLFDYGISSWNVEKKNPVWKRIFTRKAYNYYTSEFDVLYKQNFNIWDYQLVYAVIINDMYCVIPTTNHVTNLGFDENATNTKDAPPWVEKEYSQVEWPLVHPDEVEWNEAFDHRYMDTACWNGNIVRLKSILGLDINRKYL